MKRLTQIKPRRYLGVTVQLCPAVTSGHPVIGATLSIFSPLSFFQACGCVCVGVLKQM